MEATVHRGGLAARVAPIATGCALAAAGAYVALNDPSAAGSRFPSCVFRETTGLWCPGCGLTRGMHSLFTGDLPAALSFNVFTPVAAVLIVAMWWWWTSRAFGVQRPSPLARAPGAAWFVLAAVVVLYGVLRNIPLEPLRALAP
jgi:hypothetical protein